MDTVGRSAMKSLLCSCSLLVLYVLVQVLRLIVRVDATIAMRHGRGDFIFFKLGMRYAIYQMVINKR